MKSFIQSTRRGFTLLETVIAIGVLAVLLTGFMIVFAPAADGIRKSINVQQADRMVSALEQELVNKRASSGPGFDKAFNWIRDSNTVTTALFVYQYRASLTAGLRQDGTQAPEPQLDGNVPGEDYIVIPMVRRGDDLNLTADLAAIEGALYLVKCTQLVYGGAGEMVLGTPGQISDPRAPGVPIAIPGNFPEAVIAFSADFHLLPAKTTAYLGSTAFADKFADAKNPVFSRNLAVRR